MTGVWLSRVTLRKDAGMSALAPVLLPEDAGVRASVAHRLVWALLGDRPDRRRDFLWREIENGRFIALSQREPAATHPLFTVETKPFAPNLRAGDRLAFSLRANPTVDRKATPENGRRQRADVVMDALYRIPKPDRAALRRRVIQEAGVAWLERQGPRCGFRLTQASADSYERLSIRREGAQPLVLATLDLDGVAEVTDPLAFLAAVATGLGRGRAFGCGLMLLRRK